jgi:hypothetical protein
MGSVSLWKRRGIGWSSWRGLVEEWGVGREQMFRSAALIDLDPEML